MFVCPSGSAIFKRISLNARKLKRTWATGHRRTPGESGGAPYSNLKLSEKRSPAPCLLLQNQKHFNAGENVQDNHWYPRHGEQAPAKNPGGRVESVHPGRFEKDRQTKNIFRLRADLLGALSLPKSPGTRNKRQGTPALYRKSLYSRPPKCGGGKTGAASPEASWLCESAAR